MKTLRILGRIKALSPIFHGGDEKTGSETMLRRLKFAVGGKLVEVPYISGNAIRGYLRRLAVQDFLERVGYEIKNLKLFHAFFSGGVLETVEEGGYIDLELRRKVRELLVPLSVFGFAYKNQVFEGKLIVGHALPICRELEPLLRDAGAEITGTPPSIYDLLDWEFATRMEEKEWSSKGESEEPVQMIYRYEVFIAGSEFFHYFVLQDTTEVEESFFRHLINLWRERPFIGGRSSAGCGRVEISYDVGSLPEPEVYIRFLRENRERIADLIRELEKM